MDFTCTCTYESEAKVMRRMGEWEKRVQRLEERVINRKNQKSSAKSRKVECKRKNRSNEGESDKG